MFLMVQDSIPTNGESPDNLTSIESKMRNPPGRNISKVETRKGRSKIPGILAGFFTRTFRRKGTVCENFLQPKYAGKRFKSCPIKISLRLIDDPRPWYCRYCNLRKDPEPNE